MSLKNRLILIVCLAALVLGSAIFALAQVVAQSDAAREASARVRSEATVTALARVFTDSGDGEGTATALTPLDPPRIERLRSLASSILVSQVDTDAGYCSAAGLVALVVTSPGPHGAPRPRELPPDRRDATRQACLQAQGHGTQYFRLVHPHDITVIAVQGFPGGAAFSEVRVPTHPEDEGRSWPLKLAVTVLATLLLVVVTIDAIFALRRGAGDLELGLLRLQEDLRADLPIPRAQELARIATGLGTMAAHLATAREHERTLARSLAHQQRLAGLGRVVAGVAHEIRNPLTGIKLKLDTMARRALDARSLQDVAVCLQEVARLDAVVAALLIVARKRPTEKEAVALGPLIAERVGMLAALAESRRVRCEPSGNAVVTASRDALARVVDNLLRNAIEASPEGGVIHLQITQAAAVVLVSVTDAGAGVPPDRLAELFEPFFTTKSDGTGLGLWLSRSLVEVYDGQLEYHREDGTTRFSFTLPAA